MREIEDKLTIAVRKANRQIQITGGSTRRYVRDCLLPEIEKYGLTFHATSPNNKQEWKPIESAPSCTVDLWAGGQRYTNCIWGVPTYGNTFTWVQLNASYDCNGPVDEAVLDPSHWMPLPEPPEQ